MRARTSTDVDSLDPAGELVGVDDLALDCGGDADRRRTGWWTALGFGFAAGGDHRKGRQRKCHAQS